MPDITVVITLILAVMVTLHLLTDVGDNAFARIIPLSPIQENMWDPPAFFNGASVRFEQDDIKTIDDALKTVSESLTFNRSLTMQFQEYKSKRLLRCKEGTKRLTLDFYDPTKAVEFLFAHNPKKGSIHPKHNLNLALMHDQSGVRFESWKGNSTQKNFQWSCYLDKNVIVSSAHPNLRLSVVGDSLAMVTPKASSMEWTFIAVRFMGGQLLRTIRDGELKKMLIAKLNATPYMAKASQPL
jgi:hypothetical protein